MRRIASILLSSTLAFGADTVTWTNKGSPATRPSYVGYTDLVYDSASQQTIVFAAPTSASGTIYYTSLWSWASGGSGAWTHLTPNGGTEEPANACTADAANIPGERHVSQLAALDSRRGLVWIEGGVDVVCAGPAPNTNPRQDIYYRTLTADPTQGVWTRATSTAYPTNSNYGPFRYDSDHDLFVAFGTNSSGFGKTWIYCSTVPNGGGTPTGSLSSDQTRGNCSAADNWADLAPTGVPVGVSFSTMVWVPGSVYGTNNGRMIQYGGQLGNLTSCHNQTWTLNVEAKTWTQVALSTTAPPLDTSNGTAGGTPADNCQPALAWDSSAHVVRYHRNNDGSDYHYNPATDTWTQDTPAGTTFAPATGGTTRGTIMAYDASCTCLVAWNQNAGNGNAEIWQGVIGVTATFSSARSSSGVLSGSAVR